MSLTPRRLEALSTLQRLYEQAGESVHYSLVAARMRISAWTAYDLLRELENLGLVSRTPDRGGRRGAGRARILFAPRTGPAVVDEAVATLTASFQRFAAMADDTAAISAYLAEPAADLGYQLGFWLGRLEAVGQQAAQAARAVLEGGGRPALKIQAVAAMGMGSALARLERSRLAAGITAAAARFALLVEDASVASDAALAALVDAARLLNAPPATATTEANTT